MSHDEFMRGVADKVLSHGRAVLSVFEDPIFAYSIGNSVVGLPELIVFGLAPQDATALINLWSERMVGRAAPLEDGELVDIGGRFPVKAVACPDCVKERYTLQAGAFLRRDYDVVQLLVPDEAGRFPGDPLCDPAYAVVPVLRRPLQ